MDRTVSENEWLVNEYYRQTFRITYFKNPNRAVVINGKKYWPHVVELADLIKEMRAQAKNEKELKEVNAMAELFVKFNKSLMELI